MSNAKFRARSMTARHEYTFHALADEKAEGQQQGFECLRTDSARNCLARWDLNGAMRSCRFRFDEPFEPEARHHLLCAPPPCACGAAARRRRSTTF